MTTPALVATNASYTSVRYYTAVDPYYYTVDNRPLTDITANATSVSSSVDSARIGLLLDALGQSSRLAANFPASKVIQGLVTSNTSTSVTINPGVLFDSINMTASLATPIIKQAMYPTPKTLAVNTVTLSGAQSCIYAIEARFMEFGASTSGSFPFFDPANTFLPANMLFGELQIQVTPGAAAATGTQVAPGVTAGWFQLFLVDVTGPTASQTLNKIYYPYSPSFNSWGMSEREISIAVLSGATATTLGDFSVMQFADAATQSVVGGTHFGVDAASAVSPLNPYKPIKVKLNFAPSVSSNNFTVQVAYKYLYAGSAVNTISYTSLTAENIAAGTANQLQTVTLTNMIPSWGEVALSSGIPERLRITLARNGSAGGDTNTGALNLISLYLYQ